MSQFGPPLRVKTKCSSLLASLRKRKKANNWDYFIAGEKKKGIWGPGDEAAIFVIFRATFFL